MEKSVPTSSASNPVQSGVSKPEAVSPNGGATHNSIQHFVHSLTNKRENNEDSFILCSLGDLPGQIPLTLLGVADGMGGHAYGEEVSRETLRSISLSLFEQLIVEPSLNHEPNAGASASSVQTLSQALVNALEQANAHIRRMVEANKWGKAGSTVVIALITGNTAIVANLGDSPLFHYKSDSRQASKITDDHTVAGVLLRSGMITPEMARVHEGRSRLEFYIGGSHLPREAPVHQITLEANDILMLCSDGISGPILDTDIERILCAHANGLRGTAEALIESALKAGETDNQTLVLWRHVGKEQSDTAHQQRTDASFAPQPALLRPASTPTVNHKEDLAQKAPASRKSQAEGDNRSVGPSQGLRETVLLPPQQEN